MAQDPAGSRVRGNGLRSNFLARNCASSLSRGGSKMVFRQQTADSTQQRSNFLARSCASSLSTGGSKMVFRQQTAHSRQQTVA